MHRIITVLFALLLFLTACGSAESSFRDQLADLGFSDETADCLIEELEARGLGVEDVTDQATEAGMPEGAYEAMTACSDQVTGDVTSGDVDLEAMEDADDGAERIVEDDDGSAGTGGSARNRPLTSFEQAFVQGATDEGVSEDAALCILDELEGRGMDIVSLATMDDDDMPEDVMAAIFACGDELIDSGAFDFESTGGFAGTQDGVDDYGDDPALDALWEGCAAGDAGACDDLFWESPLGSAYEAFGHTCGGTTPAGADCGSAFGGGSPGGTAGGDYGSDPALDALYDSCAAGDGAACDELYFTSPFGSDYEAFGDTCGGRYAPGQVLCSEEPLAN